MYTFAICAILSLSQKEFDFLCEPKSSFVFIHENKKVNIPTKKTVEILQSPVYYQSCPNGQCYRRRR